MLGVLIGGLFMFGFGGMLLILVLGARRIEEEIKMREAQAIHAQAARLPRFFVVTQPASPRHGQLDDILLGQLQRYVEAEQTLADEFVLQPSIESLYRESARRLTAH